MKESKLANDINQCNFIGRLGKAVETRYMQDGSAVASFSIAVGWKSKDKEGAEWINITAFGKLAEICSQYLSKGSKVYISGRLKNEKYINKEGIETYSTKIIAENMQMLDMKPSDVQHEPAQEMAPKKSFTPNRPPHYVRNSHGDMDSDIPFANPTRGKYCFAF